MSCRPPAHGEGRHPCCRSGTGAQIIRVLCANLSLRPPIMRSNGADYKDARLNRFIETELANFDVLGPDAPPAAAARPGTRRGGRRR